MRRQGDLTPLKLDRFECETSNWRTHEEEPVQGRADHRGAEGGRRGAKLQDVVRRLGVSEQTYYRWKAKYGGMEVSDAKKLKALEDENRPLKTMVADHTLDIQMLKAVVANKW